MTSGYDTVKFSIAEKPGNLSLLQNRTEHTNERSSYNSGYLDNLRVNISDSGTTIKGSLSRYYHGSNCNELTISETNQAILRISEALWLPIEEAKVTRIDFGYNIVLDYPPELYYEYLGQCPYLIRIRQPNSLYYQNGNRQLVFYNKIAEARKNIPLEWKGANVMRAELRLLKDPASRLKKSFINGATLSEKGFFKSIQNAFVKTYNGIQKINGINVNYDAMKQPSDVINQLAAIGLSTIGSDGALQLLSDLKARKTFARPEYYTRLKKQLNTLNQLRDVSERSPLLEEFNSKVESIYSKI